MAYQPEYPFPRLTYGQTLEVAPGLHWIRMPLPFDLNHINLWLLADGDGWTVVDTGYNSSQSREIWRDVLENITGGAPPNRVICTHFHPDHMGLAGWFAEEFGTPIWMTYTEWLQAHVAATRTITHDFDRWIAFFRDNGASTEMTDGFTEFRKQLKEPWYRLPETLRRIQDQEVLKIGQHEWQVITGGGHTHEHASLWCEELSVLISGDQILPRITSNISLWYTEPEGDPLGDYFSSFGKFAHLPRRVLALPSHDYPFRGVHGRLEMLRSHHELRLDSALEACSRPLTATEAIPSLFAREIGPREFGFAIGETLAHLNHLVARGQLTRRKDADSLVRYRQV